MRTERIDPPRGSSLLPRPPHRARPFARSVPAGLLLAGLLAALPAAPALAQAPGPPKTPQPPPPTSPQPEPSTAQAPGVRYSGRLMIGDAGQPFELSASDGTTFRLQSLRDKQAATLVFLQRAEGYLEGYSDVGDSLAGQGVRLVFLSQQRPIQSLRRAWKGMVIVQDRQGDVARSYGALDVISGDTVPSLYLLDRKGKVRYYAVGRLPSPSELLAISLAVLEEPIEE
jgi:peroxiredoxin